MFTSPLDISAKTLLSPFSPHVNTSVLRNDYGLKSRKKLFSSTFALSSVAEYRDCPNADEGPLCEELSDEENSILKRKRGIDDSASENSPAKRNKSISSSINSVTSSSFHPNLLSYDFTTALTPASSAKLNNSTPSNSSVRHTRRQTNSPKLRNTPQKSMIRKASSSVHRSCNVQPSYVADGLQPQKTTSKEGERVNKLKDTIKKKNREINRLRMQIARARIRRRKSASLTAKEVVTAAKPFLKPSMQILLEAQVKLSSCKKKGMRWSKEMKDFTLGLLYHGPRCYRYLSKLIPLPSISTINRYQSVLPLKPGIHEHVRVCFMENIKTWSQNKKICVLIIDEMSIMRHLEYDVKRDFVNGYADDGTNRSNKQANLGIVAVIQGILSPWKQVVGHWFTSDGDDALVDVIYTAVLQCVDLASEAGLILKLFVCDQGAKNRKLCGKLGVTPDTTYFMNGSEKVYFMWDPPHLIKSLRNNLLKHDFRWRGNVVSWQHIKALYFLQRKMRLKLTPKLTRRHVIFRSSFSKMKVKLATQVFSNSVNVAIDTLIAFNRISAKAIHTAVCCKDINDAFDCFNSLQFVKDKFSLRYAISKNSEHIPFLNPKLLNYFERSAFLGVERQPYCLNGWILSIRSLLSLVDDLSDNYNVKSIRTRLLNQDVLENLFSTLRQQHGCSDNPTTKQLEKGLRMMSLSSLVKISNSSNCEDEMEKAVVCLSKLPLKLTTENSTDKEDLTFTESLLVDVNVDANFDIIEECALYYCCGFLTRQFLRQHKCYICEFKLLVDPDERMLTENYQMFMYFKAHSVQLGTDFGHLKAPSHESFGTLKKIDNLFHQIFATHSHERHIAAKIRASIAEASLSLNLCSQETNDEFLSMMVRTRILWEVRFMNRNFEEERIEQQIQRKLKKLQSKDAVRKTNCKEGSKKKTSNNNKQNVGTWKVESEKKSSSGKLKDVGTWNVVAVENSSK